MVLAKIGEYGAEVDPFLAGPGLMRARFTKRGIPIAWGYWQRGKFVRFESSSIPFDTRIELERMIGLSLAARERAAREEQVQKDKGPQGPAVHAREGGSTPPGST